MWLLFIMYVYAAVIYYICIRGCYLLYMKSLNAKQVKYVFMSFGKTQKTRLQGNAFYMKTSIYCYKEFVFLKRKSGRICIAV